MASMTRGLVARAWKGVSSVGMFGATTVVLAVAGLVFIRAATTHAGLEAWASVAVGQALGAFGAVLAGYGWGSTGPTLAARLDGHPLRAEYLGSLKVRAVLAAPITVVIAAITWALPSVDAVLASLAAIPVMLGSMTANYVFIGKRMPGSLFVYDTVPRVAGIVAGILALSAFGASLEQAVLLQCAGGAAAILTAALRVVALTREPASASSPRTPGIGALLKRERNGVASVTLTAAYDAVPIMVVSLVAPGALPHYSVMDKIYKQVFVGLSPLSSTLLGWVPAATGAELHRRVRASMAFTAVAAVGIFGATMLLGGWLAAWMSSGEYRPSGVALLFTSLTVALAFVGYTTAYACLVPLGKIGAVARHNLVGYGIGVAAVAVLAPAAGVEGAVAGLAIGVAIPSLWNAATALRTVPPDDAPVGSPAADAVSATDG